MVAEVAALITWFDGCRKPKSGGRCRGERAAPQRRCTGFSAFRERKLCRIRYSKRRAIAPAARCSEHVCLSSPARLLRHGRLPHLPPPHLPKRTGALREYACAAAAEPKTFWKSLGKSFPQNFCARSGQAPARACRITSCRCFPCRPRALPGRAARRSAEVQWTHYPASAQKPCGHRAAGG